MGASGFPSFTLDFIFLLLMQNAWKLFLFTLIHLKDCHPSERVYREKMDDTYILGTQVQRKADEIV